MSVLVPWVVPLTTTDTPGSASPDSSVTVPWIVRLACCAVLVVLTVSAESAGEDAIAGDTVARHIVNNNVALFFISVINE